MNNSSRIRNWTNSSSFFTFIPGQTVSYHLSNDSSRSNLILIAVTNSVLSCSGIVLNMTFMITVFKTTTLHTVANVIPSALSLNDFVTSLMVIPSIVYSTVLISQGRFWCTLHIWAVAIAFGCISTSLLLIMAMSVEKYLAICYPFWYEENVTKMKVFCVCFLGERNWREDE